MAGFGARSCEPADALAQHKNSWLFYSPTTVCGCGVWDNDASTVMSRLFLPVLYLSGAALVVHAVSREQAADESENAADNESLGTAEDSTDESNSQSTSGEEPPKKERLWYIDFARVACIVCTVVEHSGGHNYSEYNVMWVQQWVLPYLYLISGMAFMLSSGPLWQYEMRLAVVCAVGVTLNYIGTAVQQHTWTPLFGYTVFQMAYVIVLMTLSVVTEPLRQALRWRADNPTGQAPSNCSAWVVIYGLLSGTCFVYFISDATFVDLEAIQGEFKDYGGFLWVLPFILAINFGLLFIIQLAACLGKSDLVPWIVIALGYLPQMGIAYYRGGHSVNVHLFILGMLVLQWPMRGAATVARLIHEYWPMFLVLMLILTNPHVQGRCDVWPMNDLWERVRFYLVEVGLIVAFLSGAMNPSDSHRLLPMLNMWALYAYCTHIFWARLLSKNWGAMMTLGSMVPFLVAAFRAQPRDGKKSKCREIELQPCSTGSTHEAGLEFGSTGSTNAGADSRAVAESQSSPNLIVRDLEGDSGLEALSQSLTLPC